MSRSRRCAMSAVARSAVAMVSRCGVPIAIGSGERGPRRLERQWRGGSVLERRGRLAERRLQCLNTPTHPPVTGFSPPGVRRREVDPGPRLALPGHERQALEAPDRVAVPVVGAPGQDRDAPLRATAQTPSFLLPLRCVGSVSTAPTN
ncbi:hypothetical protein THAOC_20127 [Thalassiosira oceanica]|uniref:Uncharacterized protein n=1 Tax=Thalassiosira oceanica TaxID=159749 RepID=K0S0N2_THAOC|nr:hypothetical protein THAOC_20127 [Thalassiosira oceanica]|eukprot:EJK59618.1 hypothetical protein THAOC_20127 [Thalassiosira oceanica]